MVIGIDRIGARGYRAEQDIRKRLIAVRRVRGGRVERSAGADRNRVDVVGELLVVTPVAGVTKLHHHVSAEGALKVDAGVLGTIPRNGGAGPGIDGGWTKDQAVP